ERLRDGPEKRELDKLLAALRRRWIAARRAEVKGHPPTTADLRLELERGDASVFAAGVRQEHAELPPAAQRTGGPEGPQGLEALESRLMPELVAAYARPGVDPLARFEALTVADVEELLQAPYAIGSSFTEDEQARYHELSSRLEVIRHRLQRWQPVALTVDN